MLIAPSFHYYTPNLTHACSIYLDEFFVTLSPLISYAGHVRVPLLAITPHDSAIIELVLAEEPLWVVIRVNVDLGQGIMSGWFLNPLMDPRL